MSTITPGFEAARCVRFRFRYSACRRCADACPHAAIAPDAAGIVLDAAKCRNCALCAAACPTAALVPGNLPRIELLKQAITLKEKRHAFACAPSGLAAPAVVPCLGALDAAMLAYLGKRGIEVKLSGAAHCERCEHGTQGAAALARHVEARDRLEQACAGETWAALDVADDAAAPAARDFRAGRRGLFRRLLGRGVAEAEKAICAPMDVPAIDRAVRPGPWHVPEMRELLAIVCLRAGDAGCRLPANAALAVAGMRLDGGCTHCEACIRVCPTGALQIRESERDWTFMFFVDRCVGCGVCAEVCQPRVLRADAEVDATPGRIGVALDVLAKQRCSRCDRFFVSPEPLETCPVCRDDEDAFGHIFG